MEHMNQQLKTIFSKNIYDLDRYTVNLMITKLECLGNYYLEIASALTTFFPVRRLHPWVFVLTYEDLMCRFLLDWEIKSYTSVYRFRINKSLISRFRRKKNNLKTIQFYSIYSTQYIKTHTQK